MCAVVHCKARNDVTPKLRVGRQPKCACGDEKGVNLVFAISRRFRQAAIDEVMESVIDPVLDEHGISLTCTYASDNVSDVDHWIHRMGLIFDLADVHIVIDISRSGNTLYEFEYSNISLWNSERNYFDWLFGFQCSQPIPAFRIIIHDQVGRYNGNSVSYFNDRLRVGRRSASGSTLLIYYDRNNISDFKKNFVTSIDKVLSAVKVRNRQCKQRELLLDKFGLFYFAANPANWLTPESSNILLRPIEFDHLRRYVAQRIRLGTTIPDAILELRESESANDESFDSDIANGKMAERAAIAVQFARMASKITLETLSSDMEKIVSAAIALRFSRLYYGRNWSASSFYGLHRNLRSNRLIRFIIRGIAGQLRLG